MAKKAKKKIAKKKIAKRKTTIPAAVLKALGRRKSGATTDELAKLTGAKGASVSSACSKLVRAGKLRRTDGAAGRGTEARWIAR